MAATPAPAAPHRAPPAWSADGLWVDVRVDAIRVAEPTDGVPAADCQSDEPPVEGRTTCIAFAVYGNEHNPDGVANTHVFVCSLDGGPAREVAPHGRGARLDVGLLTAGTHTFRCEVEAPGGRPLDSNLENNFLAGTFEVRSPATYYAALRLVRPEASITTHHPGQPGQRPLGHENPGNDSTEPYDSFEIEVRSEGPATPRFVNVICTTPGNPYPRFDAPQPLREGTFVGGVPHDPVGAMRVRLVGPAVPEGQSLQLECELRALFPDYLPDRNPGNDRMALSITGGPATQGTAATER